MRRPTIHSKSLTLTQMTDYLESVVEAVIAHVDDADDLDAVLVEEIDRARRRGVITSDVHDQLYWQLGVEI
jgi:hypothetical protein